MEGFPLCLTKKKNREKNALVVMHLLVMSL